MKFCNIFLVFVIILNSLVVSGQGINNDSAEFKTDLYFRENTPELSFDSAHFSTNGQYALVLKGSNLNGASVHYWTLYTPGLNKPIAEYIVIIKDTVYFITYDDGKMKDSLVGTQIGGNKCTWAVSRKYRLNDFLDRYDLKIKPKDLTDQLKIKVDSLPPINKKIPWEVNSGRGGDSITYKVHLVRLNISYNGKTLFTDTIQFFAPFKDTENTFTHYFKRIEHQILEKKGDYYDSFGKYFIVSKNIYFLRLHVESHIFYGYTCRTLESKHIITLDSSIDPKADVCILKSY